MPQGGRFIRCDRCEKSTFSLNLPWQLDDKTIAAAKEAGWRIVNEPDVNFVEDICPDCIALECSEVEPKGFVSQMTPEQLDKALAYEGSETFGDPKYLNSPIGIYNALIKCADVVLPRHRRT